MVGGGVVVVGPVVVGGGVVVVGPVVVGGGVVVVGPVVVVVGLVVVGGVVVGATDGSVTLVGGTAVGGTAVGAAVIGGLPALHVFGLPLFRSVYISNIATCRPSRSLLICVPSSQSLSEHETWRRFARRVGFCARVTSFSSAQPESSPPSLYQTE